MLAGRHDQEQQDLLKKFDDEKQQLVDQAISDLQNRFKFVIFYTSVGVGVVVVET